jgi:hypothetical protein
VASEWLPIETLPDDVQTCWICHADTGVMVVATRHRLPGVWRLMWANKTLAWRPTHWQRLPEPKAISK